jgi:diaminohydroxyphosphoribosylaminopyrimidine deaminase/5-amino-6-(5-phosphoribosylamino)uracil reductase
VSGKHNGRQRRQWKLDHDLMTAALGEAEQGRGKTYPNPAVGAIVTRGGRIVGRGFHRRWGLPHAEVEAMRDAGPACKGADLYVTLEPCCHSGKTPPCTDAIINRGIKRVFVAVRDPNPMVNGRGISRLRDAGIEVVTGLCGSAARKLNETYFKFMKEGRPFVTLKVGQTLDGKIATRDRNSRWITSPRARHAGRRMRAEAQAILVGANTVVYDNPMLLPVPRRKTGYVRCVLDSRLSIPLTSNLVKTAGDFPVRLYCTTPSGKRSRRLEKLGVDVISMRGITGAGEDRAARKQVGGGRTRLLRGSHLRVDLRAVLEDLASRDVMHLFVEGGAATASAFLEAGLVDKVAAFIAPKVLGDVNGLGSFANVDVKSLDTCYGFRTDQVRQVGEDILMTLYPRREKGR